MKRFVIITLTLSIILLISNCGPSKDQAIEYNDAIVDQQIAMIGKIDALQTTYEDYIPEEMDAAFNEALTTIKSGIQAVKNMEDFDGNTEFKEKSD